MRAGRENEQVRSCKLPESAVSGDSKLLLCIYKSNLFLIDSVIAGPGHAGPAPSSPRTSAYSCVVRQARMRTSPRAQCGAAPLPLAWRTGFEVRMQMVVTPADKAHSFALCLQGYVCYNTEGKWEAGRTWCTPAMTGYFHSINGDLNSLRGNSSSPSS